MSDKDKADYQKNVTSIYLYAYFTVQFRMFHFFTDWNVYLSGFVADRS